MVPTGAVMLMFSLAIPLNCPSVTDTSMVITEPCIIEGRHSVILTIPVKGSMFAMKV